MEQVISHLAEKLGLSQEKAAEVAAHLQDQGHDLEGLLQEGSLADRAKGLLGDRAQEFLGHLPGIGGLLDGESPEPAEVSQ